jgi:hypothetical protein
VISGAESRKAIGRGGSGEVVALGSGVAEKCVVHDTTDRVATEVGGIRVTETIAKPTGQRLATALLQGFSQDVEGW